MDSGNQSPSLALQRLVNGYQVTQALHVAAVLGVADLRKDGARTSDELAEATGAHYRLLRALASVGVFREEGGQRFALTPLGEGLRSDAPESLLGWVSFVGDSYQWLVSGRYGASTYICAGAAQLDFKATTSGFVDCQGDFQCLTPFVTRYDGWMSLTHDTHHVGNLRKVTNIIQVAHTG